MSDSRPGDEPMQLATSLATTADLAAQGGDFATALRGWAAAAEASERALDLIAPEAERTRSLLINNVAMLWLKAEQPDRVERFASKFLAHQLSEALAWRLRHALQESWFARSREGEDALAHIVPLDVRLVGRSIRFGIAPIDQVTRREVAIPSLIWRAAEFRQGLPYRPRGEPTNPLISSLRTYAAAPLPGSYMMRFRIGNEAQFDMFDPNSAAQFTTDRVVQDAVDFVAALAEHTDDVVRQDSMDAGYRSTLTRLAADLAPDGAEVSDVFVSGGRSRRARADMDSESRTRIRASVRRFYKDKGLTEVTGYLGRIDATPGGKYVHLAIRDSAGVDHAVEASRDLFEELARQLWLKRVHVVAERSKGAGKLRAQLLAEPESAT